MSVSKWDESISVVHGVGVRIRSGCKISYEHYQAASIGVLPQLSVIVITVHIDMILCATVSGFQLVLETSQDYKITRMP